MTLANKPGVRSPRWLRGTVTAIACGLAFLAAGVIRADAASTVRVDAQLLAALRADHQLRRCDCIRVAAWLDESYPRITVDAQRWNALDKAARSRFGARALHVAESVYYREWGTPDIYGQIFIVDQRNKLLATHESIA